MGGSQQAGAHQRPAVNDGHRVVVRKASNAKSGRRSASTSASDDDKVVIVRKATAVTVTNPASAATGAAATGDSDLQARADAGFEEWVVASRLAPIRDQLLSLGVADKSDLAELDHTKLRDLRSGLKEVGQKKFDKDLRSVGVSLDADTVTSALSAAAAMQRTPLQDQRGNRIAINAKNPLGLDSATLRLVRSADADATARKGEGAHV